MLKFTLKFRPTLLFTLLLPCLLPSYSDAANITTFAHHRYSGTNAGLTHRSHYFPKIDHRLRDPTSRNHLFSDTNSETTRTDLSENPHSDNGSEQFTPNPRFSLSSLFQSPPLQASLQRSSIHHQRMLTPNNSRARERIESFNQFPEFDTSTAPPVETVTSNGELSKLDAMLNRLESANEELIVELQHERDELVTRKKRKHHGPAHQSRRHHRDRHDNEQVRVGTDRTHHTSRRPRYHQRASTTDAVNSVAAPNFIINNNNDLFNFAGRRDGSYRRDSKDDNDRLEYRHLLKKADHESFATQLSQSVTENGDHESQMTRGESPDVVKATPTLRQTRGRTPKGGSASRAGNSRRLQNNYNNQYPDVNLDFTSRNNRFLSRIQDTDKKYLYQNVNTNSESEILRAGQNIGSVFGTEYESVGNRLDNGGSDGDEMVADDVEATVVEEADYQDEDARVRGRGGRGGSVQQQHHIRERDAQSLRLASENVRYVMTNAQCSLPVRRCIDLSVNQTIIGKKYWPRCAIVSRCGEESGCCYSPQHVCSVAETHLIDLYFFYMTFEANSRAGVDRLTFENHTKCECRPRPAAPSATLSNDEPAVLTNSRNHNSDTENTFHASPLRQQRHNNNYDNNIDSQEATKSSGHHSHQRRQQQQQARNESGGSGQTRVSSRDVAIKSQNDRDASVNSVVGIDTSVRSLGSRSAFTKSSTDKDNSVKISANTESIVTTVGVTEDGDNAAISSTDVHSCKCPEVFRPSATPSVAGTCECVCNTEQGNCRRLMKGKRYFKAKDEKCILAGECGVPACQFGPFLNEYRRCPRKREMKNGRAIPSADI